jgi:hypothetical protein
MLALSPSTMVLIWAGVLIVVVAVGGGLLIAYRRRVFAKDTPDKSGFLESLRAMRNRGEISSEEYDATRKRMAARVAGVATPPVGPRPAPVAEPGLRVAKPGFDLTGAPLPPADPTPDKPESGEQRS